MTATIAWAIDKTGALRQVKEVPNGKSCNCVCIDCGEQLIAYQPHLTEKAAYFGHFSESSCAGESVLHKAAKKLLEDLAARSSSILLPPYRAEVSGIDCLGSEVTSTYHVPNPMLTLQEADSEQQIGSLILDLLGTSSVGNNIGLEIYVRNKKTDHDKAKFEKLPIEAMEIDLSDVPWNVDRESLEKLLLNSAPRTWLNSLRYRQAKALAEEKLPQLIASRNQKIMFQFNSLKNGTIAQSFDIAISISSLKSKSFTLNDNSVFRLEKLVTIRNLRKVNFDQFATDEQYEADVLVDGRQKNQHSIPVFFTLNKQRPKSKSAKIEFRFMYDGFTDSFSFKPTLSGHSKWIQALDSKALFEANQLNADITAVYAEQFEFLEKLRESPHHREMLLIQRYGSALTSEDLPNDGWGLPDKLWAPLFIEFVLVKFKGRTAELSQLVLEDVLDRVLSLERTYKSKTRRASSIKNLLEYLKALEIISSVRTPSFGDIGKRDNSPFSIPLNITDRANIQKLLRHYPRPMFNC